MDDEEDLGDAFIAWGLDQIRTPEMDAWVADVRTDRDLPFLAWITRGRADDEPRDGK